MLADRVVVVHQFLDFSLSNFEIRVVAHFQIGLDGAALQNILVAVERPPDIPQHLLLAENGQGFFIMSRMAVP